MLLNLVMSSQVSKSSRLSSRQGEGSAGRPMFTQKHPADYNSQETSAYRKSMARLLQICYTSVSGWIGSDREAENSPVITAALALVK